MKRKAGKKAAPARKSEHLTTAELKKLYAGFVQLREGLDHFVENRQMQSGRLSREYYPEGK